MELASNLGKFEHEVLELSPREFARWLAFYKVRDGYAKQARKRSRSKKGKR